jgi:hypothetical protein
MLDAEYLKTLVKKTAEFGNGKIHIIVNNAGSAFNTLLLAPLLTALQIYMGRSNPQGKTYPIPPRYSLHGRRMGNARPQSRRKPSC